MISLQDLIDKRRERWEEAHDLEFDRQYTEWVAERILSDKVLHDEVEAKPYRLIEAVMLIVDKDKETVPFFLNEVQKRFIELFEENGSERPYFILKGRQQGFTSLITAMQLSFAIVRKNFAGFTLADTSDNVGAIFNDKARVTYTRLPESLHPAEKYNSARELFFDKLNSSWRVAVASNQVGRSRTLSFVHYSEVAFFDASLASLQKAIGEACIKDAVRIYETTANGYNEAKDLWDSGSCVNLFFEWWKTKEYANNHYQFIAQAEHDAWLSERILFLKSKGLSREQIAWYCEKYASYLDKSTIRQEYPCTPEEAFVSSGHSIFDMDKLNARMTEVSGKQWRVGQFEYRKVPVETIENREVIAVEWKIQDIRFIERADGMIAIHEEPRKNTDVSGNVTGLCPYVIGGDTAGSGIDYFTAKVLDNTDGHAVATLRVQHIDEDIYAEQVYCLGIYYNTAMIGLEINYSRQPTRILSQVLRYPCLYRRERLNTYSNQSEAEAGFETNSATKPIILQELVAAFRDNPGIECDMETLKEMTTFVKHENGRMAAIDGAHDDLVMASAIAHHVGTVHSHLFVPVKVDMFAEINRKLKKEFSNYNDSETDAEFVFW